MNRESIELLLEYDKWANLRVLESLKSVSEEQFQAIRGQFAHILFWEEIWLMRWKGNSPAAVPPLSEAPDLASFQTRWRDYHLDVGNFFSKMADADLQEVIAYDNFQKEEWAYPLWRMMMNMINHSTQHRGQIIAILRGVGAKIQPVDLIIFLDERP
jgi:uncharacterized damage-inducible protein DinB